MFKVNCNENGHYKENKTVNIHSGHPAVLVIGHHLRQCSWLLQHQDHQRQLTAFGLLATYNIR